MEIQGVAARRKPDGKMIPLSRLAWHQFSCPRIRSFKKKLDGIVDICHHRVLNGTMETGRIGMMLNRFVAGTLTIIGFAMLFFLETDPDKEAWAMFLITIGLAGLAWERIKQLNS